MDCLDEPLHLRILTSLASNLAKSPPESHTDGTTSNVSATEAPISAILSDLPSVPSGEQLGDGESEDDDEDWTEFELNHAISYAHYVASLPADSAYLPHSLPRLNSLLNGLLRQISPGAVADPSPASSTSHHTAGPKGTTAQAQLFEALLKSLLWVAWSSEASRPTVGDVLVKLLRSIERLLSDGHQISFPLVLLLSVHSTLSRCALPAMPPSFLPAVVSATLSIASPANFVKLIRDSSSRHSSPGQTAELGPFVAPHPTSPGGLVTLVAEIANILLAGSILPVGEFKQRDFAAIHSVDHTTFQSWDDEHQGQVQADQTKRMLEGPLSSDLPRLEQTAKGRETLQEAEGVVLRWWTELMSPHHLQETHREDGRHDSLFTLGGGSTDEQVELSVAVLYLMTMLDLHREQPSRDHLARLRLLLSDNTPASDGRVIEAAFICTSIIVRNNTYLANDLALYVRKLLMSGLPAFESEIASCGLEASPLVVAASKCLAICIQEASSDANDDLVSSTLYSLLNTLTHGGATMSGGAFSVRSHPALLEGDGQTISTKLSGGKKTEEQRRGVAVTAVEVVSRLALDIKRDDIIHLTISLLLQRLRGTDLIIEATIVTNLVPLALVGSDSDLVAVYRAFSQISRSAHPEDPRLSSNAVLAAQTKLARGLHKRLDCADGLLSELLVLFADKGTQTQMIAMAPTGFDSRDKEKMSHLKEDSEARVRDMKAWLAALLVPISTLLSHPEYHPAKNASPELVSQFRNLWFIVVVFQLSGQRHRSPMSEHELQALGVIAENSPALIVETAADFVASDLEYGSVLRRDFSTSVQHKQRHEVLELIPSTSQRYAVEVRIMSAPQTTLLMAIYDLEDMRTAHFRPSTLLQYFANESVNSSALNGALTAVARKVMSNFLKRLSSRTVSHSMPDEVSDEVCEVLIACTHRFRKVREMALEYARLIIETFSALMCDRKVIFTLLEILTLMRRSCELQYTDEYSPQYDFHSDKMELNLHLTDDYAVRNEIITSLYGVARSWLTLAISRAPIEVQSMLQTYLNESRDTLLVDSVEMGAGLALQYSKAISKLDRQESMMPNIGGWPSDNANLLASQFAVKNYYTGQLSGARHVLEQGLENLQKHSPGESTAQQLLAFKTQMADAVRIVRRKEKPMPVREIRRLLLRAVSVLVAAPHLDSDIIHYLVELPITSFTPLAIAAGVDAWTWLLRERPESEVAMLGEISAGWIETIRSRKGLFSNSMDYRDPFEVVIEYSPTDKKVMDVELAKARRLLRPHLLLIQILSSQFQAVKYRESGIMIALIRLMMRSLINHRWMSTHPLAREGRFSLLLFGFQMLASSRMEALLELRFRDRLFSAAFSWFAARPQWSFGSDRIQVNAEIRLLQDFLAAIQNDHIRGDHHTSSLHDRAPAFLVKGAASLHEYSNLHRDRIRLLQLLVENEIIRLQVWCNPTNENRGTAPIGTIERNVGADEWPRLVQKAWVLSPGMAIHMGERFKHDPVQREITRLVRIEPKRVVDVPEALHYLLGERLEQASKPALKWLPIWAAVPPVSALVYFQPRYNNHPLILQYGMRVLEQHPVELTFFFVPQVVQALRTDGSGYVERFIFETSKISQLFCHQIIWNMKANKYRDDDASEPDPMKPMLDRMIDMIVAGLSGQARDFYDLEFTFFDAVTSISGKLKPYIKKSKPEKKAKIDEEMANIKLSVGVYLPSNPDGTVVDLDRRSGRPLQSHAKAPFMATFKVEKERLDLPDDANDGAVESSLKKEKYDVWQSAIFKVGDDCRQDMLALQILAMFKNVFTQIGLVLYLFPYRVTATDPGCGVIDVVPNATSRDEMGRAKINDLFSYFIDKYGGVDTVTFQKARLNFIQSMAAYSVACYILQIKDRHNGNIMIDADGHIVHVDFGFLFDIGPGGIKFEPNSFKLNHEMVALMGGRESQGYRMFTELTVKAFLAIRPHAEQLCHACHLMLGTGLPSFKGEPTIQRLRTRFQLQLGERAAAEYMMGVIRNAHENMRSNVYDGFQKMQNGIPY